VFLYIGENKFLRFVWRSWDRASWYISIVKPTRCTIFEFTEYHSTCFGLSFRPSSGVQDCTHSIRYTCMSYRLVDCLLAGTRWNCSFISCRLASSQLTCMAYKYTWCCVYSLELLMMDGKTARNMWSDIASGHDMELQFHLVPASKQSTNLYDIYLMLCVQSWTPDDGRKDRLKHVEWYSVNSKIAHLVVFFFL